MLAFFMTLWMSIIGMLGFIPDNKIIESSTTTQHPPAGIPGHSAPQNAIDTCANKATEEQCAFQLNTTKLEGICLPSGEVLACTPVLPE